MEQSKKGLKLEEISLFCSQIALLLKAGIPFYEGIAVLYQDMPNGPFKEALQKIDTEIQKPADLSQAMAATGVFPAYAIHMTAIGEASGRLEEVMDSLTVYYEKQKLFKSKLKNAVFYPCFLFILMGIVLFVLVKTILPLFQQLFEQMGGGMSVAAQSMMHIGKTAGNIALIFMVVLLLLFLFTYLYSKTAKGKSRMGRFLSKFPLTKNLYEKMAARDFASSMQLMLSSGMESEKAFELAAANVEHPFLSQKITQCRELLANGASFREALTQADIFPSLFRKMIDIGDKTGNLDTVMKKLAHSYAEEIDQSLNHITSLVEPIMVAILSVVIGAILIAVMLPLLSIMSAIG